MLMGTYGAVQKVFVSSGFVFEAAGDSVVHYCLSNCLLQGHALSCYKHDIGTLSWLNAETLEGVPTPSLMDL